MKNKLLLLFISFSALMSTYAQTITFDYVPGDAKRIYEATQKNVLDTCKVAVQYQVTSVEDVKNPVKKTHNFMLLQIGERISKFSDYFRLKSDSLGDVYAQQKMDEIEALNKLIIIEKGTSSTNIFKDYPAEKISLYEYLQIGGNYYYTEDKTKPQWILEPADTIICSYSCKKAKTSFRGRNYTAWYTNEIPISDGPWKFWGLPGLILKVTDEKNEYSFICSAIERPKKIEKIYMKEYKYVNTTKKKFVDLEKGFYNNPGAIFELRGVKTDEPSRNMKSLPYNPIELSE